MIDQPPPWINLPTHLSRQTEVFRQWRKLMLEHTILNPPPFLRHLSPTEIRKALEKASDAAVLSTDELTPFVIQTRIYERQFELIGWSYFIMMGQELNNLHDKLSKPEFEKTLHEIGINAREAELSMLAAQQDVTLDRTVVE